MTANCGLPFSCVLLAALVCAVLIVASPLAARASSMALLPPPPPPPPPLPVQVVPKVGGFIHLYAQFPETWPWDKVHWQEVWTVVQWRDPLGTWYEVEGWRGGLDGVVIDEDGIVVGEKAWWVAEPDLGTGPFRWMVYQGVGGELLAISDLFDLPESRDMRTAVEVVFD